MRDRADGYPIGSLQALSKMSVQTCRLLHSEPLPLAELQKYVRTTLRVVVVRAVVVDWCAAVAHAVTAPKPPPRGTSPPSARPSPCMLSDAPPERKTPHQGSHRVLPGIGRADREAARPECNGCRAGGQPRFVGGLQLPLLAPGPHQRVGGQSFGVPRVVAGARRTPTLFSARRLSHVLRRLASRAFDANLYFESVCVPSWANWRTALSASRRCINGRRGRLRVSAKGGLERWARRAWNAGAAEARDTLAAVVRRRYLVAGGTNAGSRQ